MKTHEKSKKIGMYNEDTYRKKTGKSFQQWAVILNKAGAEKMNHAQMAEYLFKKYPKVSGWWLQMITATYEQEHGMREKYQSLKGYEISRGKTINTSLKSLYEAWDNVKLRSRWLAEESIVIRKTTPRKSMRITRKDGNTILAVNFYPKGSEKSQVVVQHTKLANMTEAKQMQSYWEGRLEKLKGMLEA